MVEYGISIAIMDLGQTALDKGARTVRLTMNTDLTQINLSLIIIRSNRKCADISQFSDLVFLVPHQLPVYLPASVI